MIPPRVGRTVRRIVATLVVAAPLLGTPIVARAQDPALFGRYMDLGFDARKRGDLDAAIRNFQLAIAADTLAARPRFELGYVLLQANRRPAAAAAFEAGLRRDPTYVDAQRQLGYAYSSLGKLRESIVAFEAARVLGTVDARDRLEVGFVSQRLGDRAAAERAFGEARSASDSAIANQAARALDVLRNGGIVGAGSPAGGNVAPAAPGHARFADFYAAPLYQTRYSNVIAQAIGRVGIIAEDHTRLSPYVSIRASRDTRSRGGPQPVIFSDNYVVPAVGLRFQPLRPAGFDGLYLYGEAGRALPLVTPGGSVHAQNDVRAGAFAIQQWRAQPDGRAGHTVPLTITSDLYADASWYSRYDRDVIGFGQLRESLRLFEKRGRAIDAFARLWTVADSRGVYYNNAVEAGPGVALYPEPSHRAFVFVESLWGRYLATPDPGVRRTYHDARVTVILAAYAWWRPNGR